MKKIVLFNHKGGVSKTTSTLNIAWKIADMGHRVLLVDADPQCNLTGMLMGMEDYEKYYEDEETRAINIKEGVSNAFSSSLNPIQAVRCVTNPRNPNLFLIPGSVDLSNYDSQLNFAMTTASTMPVMQGLPGSFNTLIEETAASVNAEYVFIDLNPGLSAINQTLFLTCDAFIIPTTPDLFSLMAVKSLAIALTRWMDWKKENIHYFEKAVYPFPTVTPKFIGFITQRFNVRNGEATRPFKDKIQEIKDYISTDLIEIIKRNDMAFSDEKYRQCHIPEDFLLCEIKDFQGLAPKSTKAKVPVFALTNDELEVVGAPLTVQAANRDEFSTKYDMIANYIISLLND